MTTDPESLATGGFPEPVTVALLTPVYPTLQMDTAATREELIMRWPSIAPPHWHLKPGLARVQPASFCRERLARWALTDHRSATYEKLDAAPADVLVWMDSDVSLDDVRHVVELVRLLVAAPADVAMVGAPVPIQEARTSRPQWNVSTNGIPGGAAAATAATEAQAETFECAGIGFGFVAIRASVLRSLPKPWFKFEEREDGTLIGEDMGWCDAARATGFRILCAPRLRANHHFITANGFGTDPEWLMLRQVAARGAA